MRVRIAQFVDSNDFIHKMIMVLDRENLANDVRKNANSQISTMFFVLNEMRWIFNHCLNRNEAENK